MKIGPPSKKPPPHESLVAKVLAAAKQPLTDAQIVDALDAAHPRWTTAKDHAGKIGIVHRVLYKARERHKRFVALGLQAFDRRPRFEVVPGSSPKLWRLG